MSWRGSWPPQASDASGYICYPSSVQTAFARLFLDSDQGRAGSGVDGRTSNVIRAHRCGGTQESVSKDETRLTPRVYGVFGLEILL
jgi:hypothetical protein